VSSVGFHLYSPIFLAEHITLSYLVTTLSRSNINNFCCDVESNEPLYQ